MLRLSCGFALCLWVHDGMGQDGATSSPDAARYRPTATSIAGAGDTPERTGALLLLWTGKVDEALPKIKAMAEGGDVPAALILGNLYRQQRQLPVRPEPLTALHFYTVASEHGSGKASELIATMIGEKLVTAEQAQGDAQEWRSKAREQGWK